MAEYQGRSRGVGVVLSLVMLLNTEFVASTKVNTIEGHRILHKRHAHHAPSMEALKMTMLVGTCRADLPVRMKNMHGTPAMEKAITSTPEEDQINVINDMKDVMKMEKEKEKEEGGGGRGEDDPLMTTFEETVMGNATTFGSDQNNNDKGSDLRERVREFLSISGIDAVLPLDCGKNPLSPEDPLRMGRIPWIVALGSLEDTRFRYHCIGVVISHHHILTDADCANSPDVNIVLLNVTETPSRTAKLNYVAGRRVHPRVKSREDLLSGNNIGLIELALPLEFNDDVQPACLPGQAEELDAYEVKDSPTVLFFRFVDAGSERDASLFFLRNVTYWGSGVCYIEVREYSKTRPTTLYNLLTKKHFCIVKNFETTGRSVVMDVDERTGRVRVLGVGGVANAALPVPIAYTHTQPHRFWVELVLRKFRDNASVRPTIE